MIIHRESKKGRHHTLAYNFNKYWPILSDDEDNNNNININTNRCAWDVCCWWQRHLAYVCRVSSAAPPAHCTIWLEIRLTRRRPSVTAAHQVFWYSSKLVSSAFLNNKVADVWVLRNFSDKNNARFYGIYRKELYCCDSLHWQYVVPSPTKDYFSFFETVVAWRKSWAELGRSNSVTWHCCCGQSCKTALDQATPSDVRTTSLCITGF